jgi:membrane protein CcdC involved in cytochrome C biogenesis
LMQIYNIFFVATNICTESLMVGIIISIFAMVTILYNVRFSRLQ